MKTAKRKRRRGGVSKAQPLTEETRREIFALVHERGLDDETRHLMQRNVVGKESLTDFTEAEGRRLVEHLRRTADSAAGLTVRRTYMQAGGAVATPSITTPQIRMLYALMHQLAEAEEEALRKGQGELLPDIWSDDVRARLDGWARRVSKDEAAAVEELMKEEASNLIEALKDKLESNRRRLAANSAQ